MSNPNKGKKVGYGKPPERTQFVKGSSGNPKGRPKGAKNLSTIFQKISCERVNVSINGRTVRMTKLEASTHQLANKAAGGDLKAIHELFRWGTLFQEPEETSSSDSVPDEREKLLMASIVRRIRQAEDSSDEDGEKSHSEK